MAGSADAVNESLVEQEKLRRSQAHDELSREWLSRCSGLTDSVYLERFLEWTEVIHESRIARIDHTHPLRRDIAPNYVTDSGGIIERDQRLPASAPDSLVESTFVLWYVESYSGITAEQAIRFDHYLLPAIADDAFPPPATPDPERHYLDEPDEYSRVGDIVDEELPPPPNGKEVLTQLEAAIRAELTSPWEQVTLSCNILGHITKLSAWVTVEGQRQSFHLSPIVTQWVRRLRFATFAPYRGAWFTATITVSPDGPATAEYDYEALPDRLNSEPAEFRFGAFTELRLLPRYPNVTPGWLLEAAYQLHQQRMYVFWDEKHEDLWPAPVFDAMVDGKPVAYRPMLAPGEKQRILSYLNDAHVVLSARGFEADLLDENKAEQVPMAFHTDGYWMWPADVAYYLGKYDIPPSPDFVAHIRRMEFQLPTTVSEPRRTRAKELAMGAPEGAMVPTQTRTDAEWRVRYRAADWGMDRNRIAFWEHREQAWNLLVEDLRYVVFWAEGGKRQHEVTFDDVDQAAAYLIGQLFTFSSSYKRPEGYELADYEWEFQPAKHEPPLGAYANKQMVWLNEGAHLDHFGDDTAKSVFAADTPLAQRALPPGTTDQPYHRYQVLRQFRVVHGVPVKTDTGPGGGFAYVLPNTIRSLIDGGWIREIQPEPHQIPNIKR
ncbi:DUF4237 domain-containing protein [Pseudonocardiaceae bacterium YIM PH 21723]|nr:DUF4237 domain-containing protein [Pseudonocardiaceae bacterium YIM PH 21723]